VKIVASESRVTVETAPRGLLAAAAHDLRIAAPVAEGESADDVRCTARFTVSDMRVRASRRHGTSDWHDPSERDAHDIETRIRDEAFAGLREIVVDAEFRDSTEGAQRAVLTVRAQSTQKVDVPVRVEREGEKTRVRGECELSLHALGTGRIQIPLGAIKLDDRVVVTFEIVLSG
jgi:hypothetical protein